MIPIIFQAVSAIPNATLNDPTAVPTWLAPFAHDVYSVINMFSWYVGGIFGLYVLFMLINYYQRLQLYRRIASMEKDISQIRYTINKNQTQLEAIIKKLDEKKRKRQ